MTARMTAGSQGVAHERADHRRNVVVGALTGGAFLAALDNSIVNAILPIVAAAFTVDLTTIEWAVTVYLLVQSALMLAVGRLGDMRGHRNVYILGLAVFVIASAVCGLATSTQALVVGRAIQAIGASTIFANLVAILTGLPT